MRPTAPLPAAALTAALAIAGCGQGPDRPNILWITVEDMSPDLGAWGDDYAHTPNVDALAARSVRYTNAFASSPVCSPSRSTLITGMYASSLGTQRLRSRFPIPAEVRGFPSYLRAAGYYTTNNVKTDYNTADEPRLVEESWDANGEDAHWRGREDGQPFFAVFNDMVTHQSRSMSWSYEEFQEQVQSRLPPDQIHDPAEAKVPPYYPDTPAVRRTLARYYDCISVMDQGVGRILAELEEDGLAEDTIVFFFSDHGAGLPRHKRVLYDSGMQVPLLVHFPEKYRHLAPAAPGETSDRLVSFVDFPAAVLSLLSLEIPDHMQGVPFLGPSAGPRRDYVFGARDRIDEAFDLARSVRSREYLYIRNYMPHLSYNQPSAFSDTAEIRQDIERLASAGRLTGAALDYAAPVRPREELYLVGDDPDQVRNLVYSDGHVSVLSEMRRELTRWIRSTHDVGFLPEADAWARLDGRTPRELALDESAYPQPRITGAAALVGREDVLDEQVDLLADPDAAVRYWGAVGLEASSRSTPASRRALAAALADPSAVVRVAAAAALARHPGEEQGTGLRDALGVLRAELGSDDADVALLACRSIELLGRTARGLAPQMREAAARYADADGDRAMFIRFSTGAFLSRLAG